ncbi:MAG: hypothetical protein JXX28_09055 [Deltaproteobacteria bacterium]|nr:hypothetical protein [Deltaproteobacteria bacterium]
MKQLIGSVFVLVMGLFLWSLVPLLGPSAGYLSTYFTQHGVADNHTANLVTAVVVNYRGFDTLGEVLVLFASVSGATFVLRRRDGLPTAQPWPASEFLATGARALFAPLVVFGAYIFVHGHLTPGGGFQGGAVVASAVLMLLLVNRDRHLPHGLMTWLESLSGFGFVLTGLIGLAVGGSFLSNKGLMPLGEWNTLFSGGLIPIIYVLVGIKVGAELSALLDVMFHSTGDADHQEGQA